MKLRKIKLEYPKYRVNRLKNVVRADGMVTNIIGLITTQFDKVNNYNTSHVRDDVLNPGPWTLHFDGDNFWFESIEQTILNSSIYEYEDKQDAKT